MTGPRLAGLRALFAQRDSLETTEAGQRWLAQVTALIEPVDQMAAAAIMQNSQVFGGGFSTHLVGIQWNRVLQVIQIVIARLEAGSYNPQAAGQPVIARANGRVLVGHGRSLEWLKLQGFLSARLGLAVDEFNRESAAGIPTTERLSQMLGACSFAFLVLTAEDEHQDGSRHARENVIHETGLFQGRYGFRRAIVLLEDGCTEFSNIAGLGQIRFPKGNLDASSEEIRKVLEREAIVSK